MNDKHPKFTEYKKRKVLVSIDEALAICKTTYSEDSRRDIFPHTKLKYRTFEELYKKEGII